MRHIALAVEGGTAEFDGQRMADFTGLSFYRTSAGSVVVYDPSGLQVEEYSAPQFAAAFSFAPGLVAGLRA